MWTIKRENMKKGTKRKSHFIGHLVTWDLRERNSIWVKWYPDPTPFETLISQLMSSTNDQQLQAKSLCHDLQSNALIGKLATTLHSSSHHEIRAMSAILLCKLLTSDSSLSPNGDSSSPSYLWPRLLPASQASLKSLLLALVQCEEVKSIAKKLCDTVSELAAGLLPDDTWPELLPFMFQSVPSDNPPSKN